MSKLNKFKKLEAQAEKYFLKHSIKCDEILNLIIPMITDELSETFYIFRQKSDGLVLCWEGNNIYGEIVSFNTPPDKIIEEFERNGQPLSEEELRLISI